MAEIQIVNADEFGEKGHAFLREKGGVLFQPALRSLGKGRATAWCILDESQAFLGGFNTLETSLRGVKTLAQPALHPHCSLFIIEPEGQPSTRIARRKKVLEAFARFVANRTERIVSLPLPVTWTDIQPLIWAGFNTGVKYTYRKPLGTAPHDEGYTSELRGHIRKALGSDLVIGHSASRDELLTVLLETAEAQGFNAPAEALSSLLRGCEEGWCRLATAHAGDALVGFAFTAYNDHEAYYLLGALSRSNKLRGVQPVLLDTAMRSMKEQGVGVYDFEGSMVPGVERFFRSFGGELVPYYAIGRAPWYLMWYLRKKGVSGF